MHHHHHHGRKQSHPHEGPRPPPILPHHGRLQGWQRKRDAKVSKSLSPHLTYN